MNMGMVLLTIVVAVAVVGAVVYFGGANITIDDSDKTPPEACADSTGILTVNAYNANNPGTAVTISTLTAGVDGGKIVKNVTSGTTTFAVGEEVEVLVGAADYIDKAFKTTINCGGTTLEAPLAYATSDNPAIRTFNTDGTAVLTDTATGGAVNQSALSVGESLIVDLEFTGSALENSGEFIYVVETPAGSGVNITRITLQGAEPVDKPQLHAAANAGSKIQAFKVPAIDGNDRVTHTLTIEVKATGKLSGGVLMDLYTMQDFIDDDGTISYGVEDSDGTAKYENSFDEDFFIAAA